MRLEALELVSLGSVEVDVETSSLVTLVATGDWNRHEVDEVEVTTQSTAEDGEVLAMRSLHAERVTSGASEIVCVASAGTESDVINDITVTTEDFNKVFVIVEADGLMLHGRVVSFFAEVLVAFEDMAVADASIDDLETNNVV